MNRSMLIEPSGLQTLIDRTDVIIVDCRFSLSDPDWGQSEYLVGHISGSHYAHLDRDLSSKIVPGKTGRHPLPSEDSLAELFGRWCIKPDSTVVVYDQSHGGIASRAWWLLRWVGVTDVRLLNGGWEAWVRNGLPVSDMEPSVCKARFEVDNKYMSAMTMDELKQFMLSEGHVLLDARDADRFSGRTEPIDPVAGHIPGATNIPWMSNVDESGVWRAKDEIRERFAGALPIKTGKVAIYCGSGVTACHLAFAYEFAGLGEAILYPGSWSEWITRDENPVATQ